MPTSKTHVYEYMLTGLFFALLKGFVLSSKRRAKFVLRWLIDFQLPLPSGYFHSVISRNNLAKRLFKDLGSV